MASLGKKGMFSMHSSIVSRSGGSTAIKSDTNKSQNYPSGGIGARSSAVRRAISSKCEPTARAVCTKPIAPFVIATAIKNTAKVAFFVSNVALSVKKLEETPSSLQNASDFISEIETLLYGESPDEFTADRYTRLVEIFEKVKQVSDIKTDLATNSENMVAYAAAIEINAKAAHENYILLLD